jgi:glycosyltransferase involved in cell wall biosynthesis
LATVPEVRDRKIILFPSGIYPKKGVDLLIQAFARHATTHPEFDLIIAGPDQTGWKSELQELARKLGVGEEMLSRPLRSRGKRLAALDAAQAPVGASRNSSRKAPGSQLKRSCAS